MRITLRDNWFNRKEKKHKLFSYLSILSELRIGLRKTSNLGLLVLINFLWAATYAATKVAVSHTGPVTLTFWVFLVACIVLYPFYLRERHKRNGQQFPSDACHVPGKDWLRFALLSVLGILPPSVLLAWGLDRSLALSGSILSLLIPVQMILLASIMLGESMTRLRWLSLTLAIVGVLILSDFDWKSAGIFHSQYLFGNILIFFGNLGSSFFNTYSKSLFVRYKPIQVMFYGYVTTLVFAAVLLLTVERSGLTDFSAFGGSTWISIFVLGIFSWGLGVSLFLWLLERFEVSQLSVSIYLLPVLAVLISSITLRERVTMHMVMGGLLVLLGTYMVTSFEGHVSKPKPVGRSVQGVRGPS